MSVKNLKNIDDNAIMEEIAGVEMSDKELEEFEKTVALFGEKGWEHFLDNIDLSSKEKLECNRFSLLLFLLTLIFLCGCDTKCC